MDAVFKGFDAVIRDVDINNRTVTWIASSEAVDRYGDIIRIEAWDPQQIAWFGKHGKIQLFHDYGGAFNVARAISAEIDTKAKQLVIAARFPKAGKYPLADQAFVLAADPDPLERTFDDVSVGFLPHSAPRSPSDDEREQLGMGRYGVIYEDAKSLELLELSMVNVPANAEATVKAALARQFGARERELSDAARRELESVRTSCDTRLRAVESALQQLREQRASLERGATPEPGSAGPAGAAPGRAQQAATAGASSYGDEIERGVVRQKRRVDALKGARARVGSPP